jgi:hypothetical protein
MKTTEPFIETPQGIFIQHAGWLRITSDFLDKSYAELWEIRDKSAVFVEINDWALAFGSFPAFFILPLFLFLPTGLVGLIGIGLMVLLITQHRFLYGLRLTEFITLFNKQFVQVVFALAVFSFLGMKEMYFELVFAVMVFFSARIGWIKLGSEWIGDKIFKQESRYEQFLIWICMQKSIAAGLEVSELSEMKLKLKKVMVKKK